jgi:hypothetical protein
MWVCTLVASKVTVGWVCAAVYVFLILCISLCLTSLSNARHNPSLGVRQQGKTVVDYGEYMSLPDKHFTCSRPTYRVPWILCVGVCYLPVLDKLGDKVNPPSWCAYVGQGTWNTRLVCVIGSGVSLHGTELAPTPEAFPA